MSIHEIQRLHAHPDGHVVFYDPQAQTLNIFNEDGHTVAIPMAAFGLLEVAEAASRIAKEIIYEGEQK